MNAQLFDISYLNLFTGLFVVALLTGVLLRYWLAGRHMRHIYKHRAHVPAAFAQVVPPAVHHRAADYTVAKTQFALWSSVWTAMILVGWTLLGGLSSLNYHLFELIEDPFWQQMALVAVFALIGGALELPWSWYSTFRLEQRFGVNKSTLGLWLMDGLKGAVVMAIIGLPLVAMIVWLMEHTGSFWWLYAWAVWAAFNLLMLVVYPTFIAPLFNKFTPLNNPELEARIQHLMQRSGFKAKGLYVMDGSRRSAHANAYFTGLGSSKRVVFFDTLLEKLSADEVEAVLAHELGHFKHRHIVQRVVLLLGMSLLGFALLGWLQNQVWFYTGLGIVPNLLSSNAALALLVFSLALPVFTFFISPLSASLSRKHEFEADAYALQLTGNRTALPSALLKLYEDNASTLTPDPVYVRWYYSHPPASERLARMGYTGA